MTYYGLCETYIGKIATVLLRTCSTCPGADLGILIGGFFFRECISNNHLNGPINKISCFTSFHSQNAHAAGGYLYLLFNLRLVI